MPKYRRNPFVSGTVTHESTGSLTGYGYIGKDIYGRFHNSPVLYKTEREAKEALMKRKFKSNPAFRTQKNQGWFFVRFRFQGKVNYLAKRGKAGFTTKLSEAQPFPEVEAIKQAEAIRGSQILRLEAADIKKYIGHAGYVKNPSASIRPLPKNVLDKTYRERVKLRGYNGPVTVLSAHGSDAVKVLKKLHPEMTKEEHASLAKKFSKRAQVFSAAYSKLLDKAAMQTWGRKWQTSDYRVSGIGSNEFSEKMKMQLRKANTLFNGYDRVARAHKMASGKMK